MPPSPICERAIADATTYGKALLKFISANDVDLTGGHQYGYYLPIEAWELFSPDPPERGVNRTHPVQVTWQDGRVTNSNVKWYGSGTRYEFRLTSFGKDFPFRTHDNLGDLLVLIPRNINEFFAYVLDIGEDIDEIQTVLGVEIIKTWTAYEQGRIQEESEDECLNRLYREMVQEMEEIPQVAVFSRLVQVAVLNCMPDFIDIEADAQLIRLAQEEFTLYKMAERKVYQPEIQRLFASIDEFLDTAQSILQSRRTRAGRSFENHIDYILTQNQIPHEMRQIVDGTRPDIIIPNAAAYNDPAFPDERLFVVGAKRTCKDRWRQVTKEAPRVARKHLITMQAGISLPQLIDIENAGLTLVVPSSLHREYPAEMRPISIQSFIGSLKEIYD